MHEIRERVTGPAVQADADMVLAFEQRQKSRLRAKLESGEEVAVMLPRGTVMRHGDLLRADDGRAVRVVAKPERVLQVECSSANELTRAAYHLGNRHVPLQIGDGWLRIADDHVLRRMLEGLGARLGMVVAPFDPEAGAYGAEGAEGATGSHAHGHAPGHGDERHGAVIHEQSPQEAHDHAREHAHDGHRDDEH